MCPHAEHARPLRRALELVEEPGLHDRIDALVGVAVNGEHRHADVGRTAAVLALGPVRREVAVRVQRRRRLVGAAGAAGQQLGRRGVEPGPDAHQQVDRVVAVAAHQLRDALLVEGRVTRGGGRQRDDRPQPARAGIVGSRGGEDRGRAEVGDPVHRNVAVTPRRAAHEVQHADGVLALGVAERVAEAPRRRTRAADVRDRVRVAVGGVALGPVRELVAGAVAHLVGADEQHHRDPLGRLVAVLGERHPHVEREPLAVGGGHLVLVRRGLARRELRLRGGTRNEGPPVVGRGLLPPGRPARHRHDDGPRRQRLSHPHGRLPAIWSGEIRPSLRRLVIRGSTEIRHNDALGCGRVGPCTCRSSRDAVRQG